jgi:hypothetical protein
MKTAYLILPIAIALLLIAGCTNVVYSKGEPCSIDACCQNDSYGSTFSCDTQGCVDAIPNWTEPDCNAPASTVTETPNATQQPTEIPAIVPTVIVKIITATPMPTPIAVSTTSDHISKIEDHNPILSLTHTGSVNIITGGWGTGAAIYVNSTESGNTAMIVNVTPDGSSISLSLAPGNYTATLPDKNDNLSEQHYFYVGENAITYVPFNGYTYRVSNGAGC